MYSDITGQQLSISTRKFPVISKSSIIFSATGRLVECRLYCRDVLLSIVREFDGEKINFLGMPFHAGLCEQIFVEIDYYDDESIPTLMISECGQLNWETVEKSGHEHIECVAIMSATGSKKMMLCYGKTYIGYTRD